MKLAPEFGFKARSHDGSPCKAFLGYPIVKKVPDNNNGNKNNNIHPGSIIVRDGKCSLMAAWLNTEAK